MTERAEFDARAAFHFAYDKQFLMPDRSGHDIESVARRMAGIHAARLITPFFALRCRLATLAHRDVHAAAFVEKQLLKARCMRGTLHLLPMRDYQVAHVATLGPRLRVCRGIYRKLALSRLHIRQLTEGVLQSVEYHPLSSREIEAEVSRRHPRTHHFAIRAVIKELWERGVLCYLNDDSEFGREKRLYGKTQHSYPEVTEDGQLSTEAAVRDLVDRFFRGYGPATVADAIWWSGLPKRDIERALSSLGSEVCPIALRGTDEIFWLRTDDLDQLHRFKLPTEDWIVFLAHEDPSLKGYFSSRNRYVDMKHYDLLFNPIGESRPSILLNGRIVGTWELDRRTVAAKTSLFTRLPRRLMHFIETERRELSSQLPELLGIS
jgi:hypothetical protein